MSSLHTKNSLDESGNGTKRKQPPRGEKRMSSKENQPTPTAPSRTKRQKLSAGKKTPPPAKPPRYINPRIAELKRQIELEHQIRDGGVKLLQASKTSKQSMEASKGLFISEAKIIGHMRELQQIQGMQPPTTCTEPRPCKAKIGISEIRIPLEWKEFEHSKVKIDSHPRGVFCLFRIGNQVMDTPSLVEVDKSTMDIIFKDVIIFPDLVEPSFTLEIEVYCSVPVEDATSKPSTPIKMLKRLKHKERAEESSSAKSCAVSPYTPRALNVTPSHRFALAGHAHLTIGDIADSCRTYALKRGMVGACGTASTGGAEDSLLLPLWGQICCRLMAEPECATMLRAAGFINVQRMVSGLPDWKRLWCVMRQNHIRCWASPEDVGKKMPLHTIDLTQSMTVEPAPRLSIRRPHSVLLKDGSAEFFMAFESKEEMLQWVNYIAQAILDLKVWKWSCGWTIPKPQSKFYSTDHVDEPPTSIATILQCSLGETETIL